MTDSHITLGHSEAGPLRLDMASLIEARAFITASSGQGKSWLMRLLVERIGSRVQVIVIDPEGEYSSLREKLPMLLVGEGGEIAADVRSAKLLARKLVELKLSAVIDLYDLADWDLRRSYVAEFLTGLMNVPKALYHSIVIPIDEAHMFASKADAGSGDSPGGASRRAVIALMSAGRKRGFSGVLASQRISKIHNDAIADAKNRFIGGITLDNDQGRAADELGIPKAERIQLRDLQPGEWYCYGPGLPRGVSRFRTDVVATSHPQAGQRHTAEVPPAPDAIKRLVSELSGLPAQAQHDEDELVAARRELAEAQRQLRARPVQQLALPAPERVVERVDVPIFKNGDASLLRGSVDSFTNVSNDLITLGQELAGAARDLAKQIEAAIAHRPVPARTGPIGPVAAPRPTPARPAAQPAGDSETTRKLPKAERSILTVLAQRGPRTKRQLAIQTGYSINGGGFKNALGALASAGFIARDADVVSITEPGVGALGAWEELPSGSALLKHWLSQLGKAERLVLTAVVDDYPKAVSKELVAQATGYAVDGGGFKNALGRLRTLELITGTNDLKASEELFD